MVGTFVFHPAISCLSVLRAEESDGMGLSISGENLSFRNLMAESSEARTMAESFSCGLKSDGGFREIFPS